MIADLVDSFLSAALKVIGGELCAAIQAESPQIMDDAALRNDVTVLVGLTGGLQGLVLLTMTEDTALAVVGVMMGEPVSVLDEMGRSALAELGNLIAGSATVQLEQQGKAGVDLTPPTVLTGKEKTISTVLTRRAEVPMVSDLGRLTLHVALESLE